MNMCKGTEFTLTPEFQSEDYRKDRSKYYYVIVLEYEKSEKLDYCQVSMEKNLFLEILGFLKLLWIFLT